jgi:hypothetical protein
MTETKLREHTAQSATPKQTKPNFSTRAQLVDREDKRVTFPVSDSDSDEDEDTGDNEQEVDDDDDSWQTLPRNRFTNWAGNPTARCARTVLYTVQVTERCLYYLRFLRHLEKQENDLHQNLANGLRNFIATRIADPDNQQSPIFNALQECIEAQNDRSAAYLVRAGETLIERLRENNHLSTKRKKSATSAPARSQP